VVWVEMCIFIVNVLVGLLVYRDGSSNLASQGEGRESEHFVRAYNGGLGRGVQRHSRRRKMRHKNHWGQK